MSEPQMKPYIDGPFQGLLSNSRVDAPPGFLYRLQNFLVRDRELESRPGLQKMGSAIGGGNDVQGVHQWQMLDGTQYTCAFANGDLWIYDWATDAWTQHDLSTEGVTLSTTGDVNCATSRGRLIVTDGVNQPVMIEGPMDGSETYTTLTNAPIAHRVGIYYAKVFFWDIPGYENEFQWSDEADPVNGYSGEDQAWEFAQTDAGRILGMAPLNERMNVMKEDSATVLLGSADENFSTLAVREGLSETEGCVAGGSVAILNGDVYLLSANGPRRIKQGQVWQSLHDVQGIDYIRDTWDDVDKSSLDSALSWVDRQERHVGWLVPQAGSSDLNTALVFNTVGSSWSTFTFSGFDMTACGSVEDQNGDDWVLFGDSNGNVYKYRVGSGQTDDDGTAIEYRVTKRISDGSHIKRRMTEGHFLFHLDGDFQGEVRPYLDSELKDGRRFGLYDRTGEVRYRRGFNAPGYEIGWELYANQANQGVTLQKVMILSTAIEVSEDWDA